MLRQGFFIMSYVEVSIEEVRYSGILHGIRLWRGRNGGGIWKGKRQGKGRKYESAVCGAASVGI
jgi:hypothetical protein